MRVLSSNNELAVIDTNLSDYETLQQAAIDAGLEVILLSDQGIAGLAEQLQERESIDAIHLFSHGSEGELYLGGQILSSATLDQHAETLQVIRNSLSEDADLLLYGCNVAAGDKGNAFLDQLAALTGANIAASNDTTGLSSLGGDWDLEKIVGDIDSRTITATDYQYLLPFSLGTTTFGTAQIAGTGANFDVNASVTDLGGFGFDFALVGQGQINIVTQTPTSTSATDRSVNVTTGGNPYNISQVSFKSTDGSDFSLDSMDFALSGPNPGTSYSLVFEAWLDGSKLGDFSKSIVMQGPNYLIDFSVESSYFGNVDELVIKLPSPMEASLLFDDIVTSPPVIPNSAPALGGTPADDTATEDLATAIDLSAYNISDGDGDTVTLTLAVDRGTIASIDGNGTTAGVTVSNSGTASMTLQGSAANLNTYLDNTSKITYITAANDTTTAVLTVTPNDGTANGTADTVNITINAVNDSPTAIGVPGSITVTEDVASNVDLATVTFADLDGDALTVTLTAAAGTFAATSGGSVTVGGSGTGTLTLAGTAANINTFLDTATNIKYTTASNSNAGTSFTIKANDGTVNPTLGTVSIGIVPVNDAPVFSNLDGNSFTYTEGDGQAVIDQGTAVTLSDVDSADFSGGSFLAMFTSGSDAAEDVLSLDTSGSVSLGGTSNGDNVLVGGVVVGTLGANIAAGNSLLISLNGSATAARLQTLSQAVTYENTDTDNPTTGARNVRITVTDGDTGTSANQDITITVAGDNDAPAISNLDGDSFTYVTGTGAAVIDQSIAATLADVDSTDFNGGALTVTITSGEDTTEDRLSVDGSVTLGGTTAGSSVSAGGFIIGTLGNNIAAGNDFVVNFNANATLARVQTLVRAVTYEDTDTVSPTTGARNVRVTLTDGDGGTSVNQDVSVNVQLPNASPTVANLNGDSFTYTEGDGQQIVDQGTAATVTDGDSADFDGGNMTVTITSGEDAAEDLLSLDTSGTVSLAGTTAGANVSVGGTVIGTLGNNIAAGNDLVVNFSAGATASRVQTLTQAVSYENTDTASPTTGARNVRVTINDGDGSTPSNNDATITIAGANDAPTATGVPASVTVTEDAASDVDLSAVSFADVDGDSLTITLTAAAGTLTATSGGGVTVGGSGTGTLTLAGTVANINTFLDTSTNIKYITESDSNTATSFTVQANDGTVTPTLGTVTVNITPVADAPTLTGLTSPITALEDTATNLVTGTPVFADVDTTADVQATLTATDNQAVLTASDANGVVVSNSGTNAITLTGTATEISTFLSTPSNLTYTGSSNNTTTDTVTVSVDDGEGGTDTTAATITVNFTAVNDEPIVSATGTGGSSTNGAATDLFNSASINVDTPDTGDLVTGLTFTVSGIQDNTGEVLNFDGSVIPLIHTSSGTTANNGMAYSVSILSGTATVTLTNITGIAEASIETALNAMTYENTAPGFTEGARVISLTEVTDNGGTSNGGDDTWAGTNVKATVTVIDGTKPIATSYTDNGNEDTPVNLSATELPTAQDVGPVDAIEYITIDTSTVTGGVLSLDSPGTAGPASDGTVYNVAQGNLSGTVNINIADINKLDFTPTTNLAGTGAASFNWTVTDAGGHTSPEATYTLNLTNTSDNPEGTDKTVSINTSQTHTFSASDFGFTDVDTGNTLNRVQVNTQTIDNGTLKLNGTTVNNSDWINLADIGTLVYTPTGTGADSFTFTVEDSTSSTDGTPNTVTLNVSSPPAPTPTPTEPQEETTTDQVDGVDVKTTTKTVDGEEVKTVVVEPVTNEREDTDNKTEEADIPLHFTEGGAETVTTVSLPTGVGFTANANDTAQDNNSVETLLELIDESAGDQEEDDMLDGGRVFLEALEIDEDNLWVNKVTLTTNSNERPDSPITIEGSNNSDRTEAMVIDASNLPSGTILNLQNIEFAVIIGPASIFGGDGQNTLYAGSGSQFIILGPDDDELHGGPGNDTVGSEGGDDLIFGDSGNDTLFGGEGKDQLHGGSDTDTARFEGSLDDFMVEQVNGVITVRSKTDDTDVDTLINIERIQFEDQVLTLNYDSDLEALAALYQQTLGRQADVDGFQWWANDFDNGYSKGNTAINILRSDEATGYQGFVFDGLSVENQIEALYTQILGRASDEEGKAYWLAQYQNGNSIDYIAGGFMDSTEFQQQHLSADEWSFIV